MELDREYRMLIGGELVSAPVSGVIDPATGKVAGQAPIGGAEILDAAVAAARSAFPSWRTHSWQDRANSLRMAADVLESHADSIADLLTSEQGKPRGDALKEVMGAAYWLRSVAAVEVTAVTNPDAPCRSSQTRRVPLGVVAAIVPWNFPVLIAFWKIAPALVTGNTIIVKPSPLTPLSTLRIGELLKDVFPAGVLNIISGNDDLGPLITAHPHINKVSFTGSTATGQSVMAAASGNLKRITLELGGNDAAIVLPDVDIQDAAKDIFWSAFANSGQVCVATKRLYVHERIYDAFAAALVDYARTVRIGNGRTEGVRLGPVQNKRQFERVLGIIEDCRANNFSFLLGEEARNCADGYFIPITIIDNPPEESRVVQEEAFGPVLPLLKFSDIDEVIARANASDYGLAGSVWSKDLAVARAIAERLETGTVWINEFQHVSPHAPFAGHKLSGFGVENGMDGLHEFTVPQTITTKAFGRVPA